MHNSIELNYARSTRNNYTAKMYTSGHCKLCFLLFLFLTGVTDVYLKGTNLLSKSDSVKICPASEFSGTFSLEISGRQKFSIIVTVSSLFGSTFYINSVTVINSSSYHTLHSRLVTT